MKIAVPYDKAEGLICKLFDTAPCFKIYDIDSSGVLCSEIVGTMGLSGGDSLSEMLSLMEADAVICREISYDAHMALYDEGINIFPDCSGDADDAVDMLLSGSLDYDRERF